MVQCISQNRHQCEIIDYSWISTNETVVDIFTKTLGQEKHEMLTKSISEEYFHRKDGDNVSGQTGCQCHSADVRV